MREADEGAGHDISAMSVGVGWHIPRPSLSGSTVGSSTGDPRSRGGSSSSQGSSSNHSTHSVSSGSLLLSAAQLARVHGGAAGAALALPRSPIDEEGSVYSANLTSYVGSQHRRLQRTDPPAPTSWNKGNNPESKDPFWSVERAPETTTDPFWNGVKRGSSDPEAASVASSTHFTVVNGFTRHCETKADETPWCCNSSHQVTVLVITMTVLISAAILAAICFVEMRLRKESDYRFS